MAALRRVKSVKRIHQIQIARSKSKLNRKCSRSP
jgi:hypothetical protein